MTVQSTAVQSTAVANGLVTTFTYQFKLQESSDLVVQVLDLLGVLHTLVLNTDYTVDPLGLNLDAGGNILNCTYLGLTIPNGYTVFMTRVMGLTQDTDLANQGTYLPETVETELDAMVMMDQGAAFQLQRTVRAALTDPAFGSLPAAAARASMYLAFDANGNPIAIPLASTPPILASVQTIAALKLTSSIVDGSCVSLDGYYAEGDGGGGLFFWNATSVLADNGGTVIQATGVVTGRWIRLLSNGITTPLQFGCKGDGATDDTTAFQNCLNSGVPTIVVPVTAASYLISQVTIPATVRSITGSGTITQKTANVTPFYSQVANNILIRGLTFVGVGGAGVGGNNDNAIYFVGTSLLVGIWIEDCTFTAFLHQSVWIQNAEDVWVTGCLTYNSWQFTRFSGVLNGYIIRNVTRDTLAASTNFQAVIAIDSTFSGYAVCQNITIRDNIVSGYANSQAILVHAGINVVITGNRLLGVNQGIGAGAFNNTDTMNGIIIADNYISANAVAGGTTGNQSINAAGFDATHLLFSLQISGNILIGANKTAQLATEGAIQLSFCDDVLIAGNLLGAWYNAGVYVNAICTRLKINDNQFLDGQNVAAKCVGVWVASGAGASTGLMDRNYFDNITNVFECDSATAGGFVFGPNNYYTNISGATLTGGGTYTAPAVSSPAVVSGTGYQNTTPGWQELYVPVTYNPTGVAAATCQVSLGPTIGPIPTLYTASIPATTVAGQVNAVRIRIPPGWYYALSVTNATIGTAKLVTEL